MTNINTKKKMLDVVDDFKPRQTSVIVCALVCIVFLAGACACVTVKFDINLAKDVFSDFIQLCGMVVGGIVGIAIPGAKRSAKTKAPQRQAP